LVGWLLDLLHQILMMGMELVPETPIFNQLTQLIAREDFTVYNVPDHHKAMLRPSCHFYFRRTYNIRLKLQSMTFSSPAPDISTLLALLVQQSAHNKRRECSLPDASVPQLGPDQGEQC
jgi:hypothetical protein